MVVENNVVHTRCPLCAASAIRKVGDIAYSRPVIFSTEEISLTERPEFWTCDACKSGFTQHAIPEREAARLYAAGTGGERWISKPFEDEKTHEVVTALERVFRQDSRVLDIGCNTGELLDFARSRGCITAGVEYCTASRELVRSKGHGCFAAMEEVDGHYDIVTAFDVVEHLYDLGAFFSTCGKIMRDGGLLVLLTGDVTCLSARGTGANWWYVRFPEHIMFPSGHYFRSVPHFSVAQWIRTYAATKFRFSLRSKIITFFKGIRCGDYAALPSFVPDHVLVVLEYAEVPDLRRQPGDVQNALR